LFITGGERYLTLYYPQLIYLALFIFLLDFRTNQQQQLATLLLILLIMDCLIMMQGFIKLNDIDIKIQNSKFKIIRRTDTYSVFDFWFKQNFETWNNIFDSNDVNSMFNSFLNIYLGIFYSSLSLKKVNTKTDSHAWIASGIRTSCKRKWDLFLLGRNIMMQN